jgi:hypothetical protein
MKKIVLSIAWLFLSLVTFAQHIYQIRADSVRIYNTCDTAELILENHTQDTLGFLYNKGKGRTEFRRLQLVPVGDTAVALPGQDTLSLRALMWSGGLSRGLIIAPDADYIIPREIATVLLRDITAPRKITLPAPETNLNREIVILDKTTGSYRWTVNGAYVTRDAKGTPPYMPQDSVTLGKGEKLILFSDGIKWYDLNVCYGGSNKSGLVNAGSDTTLPAGTTQTTLNATVTPGTSSNYTVKWSVVEQPSGGNAVFTDSTKASTNVTNLISGSYIFKITVTDELGLTSIDSIKVLITQLAQMFSSGGPDNNEYDTVTHNKTWVYLPDGYDPNRSEPYPLIIFLHAQGGNGTDINLLIGASEGLPYFLYNKTFPVECIVIAPQTIGYSWYGWEPTSVKLAYDWAVKNYKVDTNRVYLTGFSTGGTGSCSTVAAYPGLFAAYLPIAPQENVLQTNGTIAKNTGAYYVADYYDPYVRASYTWDMINSINSASPKGLYPPDLKMTRHGNHDTRLWNDNVYDKRVAPFDFEKDFFLLYHRNPVVTATNFVTRAEGKNDYTEYARAKMLVDKLPASADKTALQQRLNVQLQVLTEYSRYYLIDFGVSANPAIPNTNKLTSNLPNTTLASLKDIKGSSYPINFGVQTASITDNVNDGLDNDYQGLDHSIFKDGVSIDATGSTYLLSGLSDNASYDIRVFYTGKTAGTISGAEVLSVSAGSATVQADSAVWSTQSYLDLGSLQPVGGEISISMKTVTMGLSSAGKSTVTAILLKEKPGSQPGTKARFDFGVTAANIPGWTSVYGNPHANVQEFKDASTGWLLSTVSTDNWSEYYPGAFGSDENGMSTGTFSPDFPASVVQSFYMNGNLQFNGANYNIEIKNGNGEGLPGGHYQVKLISSLKSSILNKGEANVNVKFGNEANQLQHVYPKDNSENYVTLTGYVTQGGTIKISINRSNLNYSDVAFINALIVEKID